MADKIIIIEPEIRDEFLKGILKYADELNKTDRFDSLVIIDEMKQYYENHIKNIVNSLII